MRMEFNSRVQNDIEVDFHNFIGKIDTFRFDNSRSSKEYSDIDAEIEKIISEAILDWSYSSDSLAAFFSRMLCGEEIEAAAKSLCRKLASFVKFSYPEAKNKEDSSPEEYKTKFINEITLIANNMSKDYYGNSNSVLMVMSSMYVAIINCLLDGSKPKKSSEEIYREKFKKKRWNL